MRRRTDTNQTDIVAALRQLGADVFILSDVGDGFPDLLVGWHGRNLLIEVKTLPIRLTPEQIGFQITWRGQVAIVTNIEEAMEVLKGAG